MKNDAMSKLSAGLLVLVMALAALVLFPVGNEGQTTSSANIYVPVVSSGSPVPDAWVNLTDVHTGAVIVAQYDTDGYYYATNPPSGYYMVSVIHANYLDQRQAAEVAFDGKTNVTVSAVDLTALPSKTFSIEVTVVDSGASPVAVAYISVYDNTAREFVSHAATTTNISGKATISMFNTNLIPGHTFYMVARKPLYEMNATAVTITASNPMTMELVPSKRISGFVTDANGPASDVVAYMIDKDNAVPWVKRVMSVQGASFAFDAYDGDFVLVLDAEGAGAVTQERTVSVTESLGTILLGSQTQRVSQNTITYGSDFTAFSFSVAGAWPYDVAHPGLMYSDMGNLRMQVDLIYGDGDGLLEATEVDAFIFQTSGWGPEYVASDALLMVNDTVYHSSNFVGYPYQLTVSSIDSTDSVPFGYTCDYTDLTGAIDVDAPEYSAVAYARYDTPEVDNKYTIVLPGGYELVSNKTQYTKVLGYSTITLDPPTGSATSEPIELVFQANEKPSTTAQVTPSSGVAYVEKDANGTVIKYFVRVAANITFSAAGSTDPNGNPLLYTWDFADGSSPVTTANVTYVYNYSTASAMRMVSLTVTDVAGLDNTTEIEVVCDALDPIPVITVKDKTVNMTDYSITVNQRESVTFNATDSVDPAAAAGDTNGKIDWFEFDYGGGNKSSRIYWSAADKSVTHSFADAGTHNVWLNVTDVTGHQASKIIVVHVNDTTQPTVSFTVKNNTGGSTLTEKELLVFDASATIDNLDGNTTLRFEWDFGDGTWWNGTGTEYVNVTHTYDTPKSYTVSLNVTDTVGNYKKSPKIIPVGQGLRPRFTVDRVYYSMDESAFTSGLSGNFTEDKSGYIMVNMTNVGSLYATDVHITFYIIKADGTEELLGTSSEMRNATTGEITTNVSVGGKVQIRFPWTFDTKGTYTIKVNVTAGEQLNPTIYTSADKLTVKEAAWKQWVLWGGVIAVLILVPLLIIFRSRWSKREKKGPRREKKEKPGSSEEEL
ncbi:MAG: hypothetical protein A3K76_06000 [Euryarchaeota archaeon RBG_13_57_23]|nr:MAG: hypothetical protein A3K76_06000 [Euryarchaeota archaeon RBG_13_57_23]